MSTVRSVTVRSVINIQIVIIVSSVCSGTRAAAPQGCECECECGTMSWSEWFCLLGDECEEGVNTTGFSTAAPSPVLESSHS